MNALEFIEMQIANGLTKTAAVGMLAEITGTNERVAWRWANGVPPRNSALLLLQLWEALPNQRHLFSLANDKKQE